MQKSSTQIVLKPSPKAIKTTPKVEDSMARPTVTTEIKSKATSPTLVEFQNQNAQLPEWRLQLKNAVLKRRGENNPVFDRDTQASQTITIAPQQNYSSSSVSNGVKPEIIEDRQPDNFDNAQLVKALKRIERSRNKFYITAEEKVEFVEEAVEIKEEQPVKDYPFTIASRNDNPTLEKNEELKSSVNFPPKPKLVPKPKPQKIYHTGDLFDTSELDPNFISAKISSSFEKNQVVATDKTQTALKKSVETTEKIEMHMEVEEQKLSAPTVFDDAAPFSLRFNAGLFDVIIGSFSSMILLSPFILLGGSWFSIAGFFAFMATCAIVMFIYMTTTIGMFGKTFGMHLFSLEMIDYFDDEYPTFHQSAVSSSIFLLSLAVGGLGFVTSLFDEDRRAVHDLVSGTVVVKEI